MEPRIRLDALLASTLNGIDYVEIASPDQTALRVHFLNPNPNAKLVGTVTKVGIMGGETIPTVATKKIDDGTDWSADLEGRPVLTLTVNAPGDFSFYVLTLTSTKLDRFFDHVTFSFKVLCPSDLDCAPAPVVCPPEPRDAPPIDYLAKDFSSFRQALLDFSALRYPEWQERSEADFGMMFLEALSSLADDLSYTQDRVAAEATLDTATQRRSIVRHARLVDYEPRPATSAHVWLQFDVQSGPIPSGLVASAQGPDGATIDFETGTGLVDPNTGQLNQESFVVDPRWNHRNSSGVKNIPPYWWDDRERCLKTGATDMWIQRRDTDFSFGFTVGQALLIETAATTSADAPVREVVHLIDPNQPDAADGTIITTGDDIDPLILTPPPNPLPTPVTHLYWRAADALRHDHDLTRTSLAGNLVPSTQGRRYTETFAIDVAPTAAPQTLLALVRTGPNSTPDNPGDQYLYPLRQAQLAWLAQADPTAPPLPEIVLVEEQSSEVIPWTWRRRLLDAAPFEKAFTVDPVRFSRTAPNSDGSLTDDYAGDDGETVRFGDGSFGEIPDPGTALQVTYRVGGGTVGNVGSDSIVKLDAATAALGLKVTNPFPATGGEDEETNVQVRRRAPQAFRAEQFRAVRAEDYEKAAKKLPWVFQAGTTFRWTGSWLTVFTTADPRGTEALPVEEHTELIDLLNRYRLAGYESYVPAPHYVSLDLVVWVCARPEAFRGDVEASVLAALSTARFPDGTSGFFYFDRFSFGQPLERSALEAAIQRAHGVAGVLSIQYRRRGFLPLFAELPDTLQIHPDEILRVDNDPSRPERGSLKVRVEGGK